MTAIDDLKRALLTSTPLYNTVIATQYQPVTVTADALRQALGVPTPTPTDTAYTTDSLNVRATPSTSATILTTLAKGQPVQLTDVTPFFDGVYQWQFIVINTGHEGWAADKYLTRTPPAPPAPTPPPVPPPKPTPSKHRAGLNVLIDGVSAAQRYLAAFIPPSLTVINSIPFANQAAAAGVRYVIARSTVTSDNIDIPNDGPAEAIAAGVAAANRKLAEFVGLSKSVYIQIANEPTWNPGNTGFWLGVMQALEAAGYRAAIGAYSVGTPEPAQWVQMTEALTYARSRGHIVVLHEYGKPGDAAGTLSPPSDRQYYEMRSAALYNAVPLAAQPPLVIGEFAGEFTGQFDGPDALISVISQFEPLIAPYDYLVGYNLWVLGTNGGWNADNIESAIPKLIAYENTLTA